MDFQIIEDAIRSCPVLPDPEDSRDFDFEKIAGAEPVMRLPQQFSLRFRQTPVKDQGLRGTCTAFASIGASEYFNSEEIGQTLDLSEEFLFKKTKEIDIADYGYRGYGAHLRSAAKALQKFGVCFENTLPYSPDEKENFWEEVIVTKNIEAEAFIYRMQGYASVSPGLESIKKALVSTNSPLLGAIMLYKSYRGARTTGVLPVPFEGEEQIGGHALLIIGYDDNSNVLICKNSWGEGWGDKGYLHIPYSCLKHMYSFWSFVDFVDEELRKKFLIEQHRKMIPAEWGQEALDAWDEGLKAGILTHNSKPMDPVTKLEYIMLQKRQKLL